MCPLLLGTSVRRFFVPARAFDRRPECPTKSGISFYGQGAIMTPGKTGGASSVSCDQNGRIRGSNPYLVVRNECLLPYFLRSLCRCSTVR